MQPFSRQVRLAVGTGSARSRRTGKLHFGWVVVMSGETATAAADAKVEVMDEEVTTGSAGADRGEKLLPVVDIDVCLRGDCVCDPGAVEARVYAFVRDTTAFFSTGPLDLSHDDPLNSFVERAHVYDRVLENVNDGL